MDPDLALALRLADVADAITLPRFRARDLAIERKADATAVSDADTAAEARLREILKAERPHHAILGEEGGIDGDPTSTSRWIIDPIDGTAGFVRGMPIWATLIGLERDGRMAIGVVSAPALGRRWWAARGAGAFADGEPIHVSSVATLEEAHLAHASLRSWTEHGLEAEFVGLARRVARSRGVGDFWMHCLVAEGVCDVACEPVVNLWDLAALQVIVEEAGGRFTNLDGVARPDAGSAVSTNGLLHEATLAALRPQAR